ncbi:uncharacterized protein LOC144158190 [Haemaphysalis longicornis]
MSSSYSLITGAPQDEVCASDDRSNGDDGCAASVNAAPVLRRPVAETWWKPAQLRASAIAQLQWLGACNTGEGSPTPLVSDDQSGVLGAGYECHNSVPSSAAAAGSRARGSPTSESCSRRRAGEAVPACPALGLSAGAVAAGALQPHPRSATTRSAHVGSTPCPQPMAAPTPGGVAPLPPRYRFRDLILGDFAYGDDGTRSARRRMLACKPAIIRGAGRHLPVCVYVYIPRAYVYICAYRSLPSRWERSGRYRFCGFLSLLCPDHYVVSTGDVDTST